MGKVFWGVICTFDYIHFKVEREPGSCDVPEEPAVFPGQRLNKKMQVYSGAKTTSLPTMMSLHQQCIRTLQNNINCEWWKQVLECHWVCWKTRLLLGCISSLSALWNWWCSFWDPGARLGEVHTRAALAHRGVQPSKKGNDISMCTVGGNSTLQHFRSTPLSFKADKIKLWLNNI